MPVLKITFFTFLTCREKAVKSSRKPGCQPLSTTVEVSIPAKQQTDKNKTQNFALSILENFVGSITWQLSAPTSIVSWSYQVKCPIFESLKWQDVKLWLVTSDSIWELLMWFLELHNWFYLLSLTGLTQNYLDNYWVMEWIFFILSPIETVHHTVWLILIRTLLYFQLWVCSCLTLYISFATLQSCCEGRNL